jgi:hypothetical protein
VKVHCHPETAQLQQQMTPTRPTYARAIVNGFGMILTRNGTLIQIIVGFPQAPQTPRQQRHPIPPQLPPPHKQSARQPPRQRRSVRAANTTETTSALHTVAVLFWHKKQKPNALLEMMNISLRFSMPGRVAILSIAMTPWAQQPQPPISIASAFGPNIAAQ